MSLRDKIRSATLSESVKFKNTIVNYNGFDVEIRQPSVKSRSELFEKCTDANGKISTSQLLTWAVIYNAFVPDTNELVFEEADYEVMVSKPAGGFLDQFGDAAMKLLNVEDNTEKKSENMESKPKK